jgi:hypothetical protein
MLTYAERRAAERELLKQKALREMFPELSEREIVKKERELRLIIRDQLGAKLTPTNMNSMELYKAQEERWCGWIDSAKRTEAEIWIAMEVHWYWCEEEIAVTEGWR